MNIENTSLLLSTNQNYYQGKVRDTYAIDDKLVVISTDRLSAFDVVFPQTIPYKGAVLNGISKYFFQHLENENSKNFIVNIWAQHYPHPNITSGQLCSPIELEVIVRSRLVGSAWRAYEQGERNFCGIDLEDGLEEFFEFDEPIITPSTKAKEGHDENISEEEIISQGIVSQELWEEIKNAAIQLFRLGQELASKVELVLVDTKYEFGINQDGDLTIIDEIHTPDSSRYFWKTEIESYLSDATSPKPSQLSKEFVRQWCIENNWQGQTDTPPELSNEMIEEISDKYINLYELIVGKEFIPSESDEDEMLESIFRIYPEFKKSVFDPIN